ncbi:MAG: hypothetical protein IT380_26520 [Myxococcales bacterium]|nr:hypothetical protein [Myxococcales bacterium]
MIAFDCDGREVARDSAPWPVTQNPPFRRLSVHGKWICRVRYRSGGTYAGSTFFRGLRAE